MNENDTALLDDAQDLAELDAGFEGKTPPERKPAPAATPQATVQSEPEFVQISRKEWDEVRAAAQRTASYDQQFSKAFGTIGNIQKLLNEQKAAPVTPASRKVEIPKDAFAKIERDFPELAQQMRETMEAALSGVSAPVAAEIDTPKIEQILAEHMTKREIAALEDAYPAWREIVGAVSKDERPDPNNPFRKWLATKDATYQARVNDSESAAVISRAIRLFQSETKAPAKPVTTPRDTARAERIRGAVQPKGDGAGAAPAGKSDDDEFIAGFNSR